MSMGDWNFLGGILEEVHIHSTTVGKVWLTILFVFRMLVLGVAAEDVWNDEQANFICNTEQPGCRNACYDLAFPVSLIRYWVLQVVFVSSPSLAYMGHALYRLRSLEKERLRKKAALYRELEVTEAQRRVECELRHLEHSRLSKVPLKGSLLRTYILHVVTRAAMELAFMAGQYQLYGLRLDALFQCKRKPCPNVVDCFVSKPTEKTIFMVFMQSIASVSLLLSVVELAHLGCRAPNGGETEHLAQLKDQLDDHYLRKSDKSPVGPRVCQVTATASGDYGLLPERLTESQPYPVLCNPPSTSVFIRELSAKGPKEDPLSPVEFSTSSSKTHSPHSDSVTPHQQGALESHAYPSLTENAVHTLSCPTLLVAGGRRSQRLSAPWHCLTVEEANGCDADSRSGKWASSRNGHPVRPNQAESPDLTQGFLSKSRQSRGGGSLPTVSPSRWISLASNSSCRRVATDLQI